MGAIRVTSPPAAGTHTKSPPSGPKKTSGAALSSRAAPRLATIRRPSGDQATL
jgi:hypothetical protein